MKFNPEKPFKTFPGDPPPLSCRILRKVIFGECDPMGVMWHGHYAAYFEEAREALAEACGITYERLKKEGLVLPVKHMFTDYRKPLLHGVSYVVEATMHWSDAARINMEYAIFSQSEELLTKGFSIQLMVDAAGSLLLDIPVFYKNFMNDWAAGKITIS